MDFPQTGSPHPSLDRHSFVASLLQCYVQLPHTPPRPSRYDKRLAERLFEQHASLDTLKAAFILATSRRTFRTDNATPLEPVRSLAYFLPIVEELRRTPPDPCYIDLVARRLHTGFPDLGVPPLDPPIPWCSPASACATSERSETHGQEL